MLGPPTMERVFGKHGILAETLSSTTADISLLSPTAEQIYLQEHAQRLHNEIETTTRQLELEKRRLNRLEEEVARVRHEHAEKVCKIPNSKRRQKQEVEGNAARSNGGRTRMIRSSEQCLEKLQSKRNALLHDNLTIRGKIDDARRERLQINQVFKKLQSDIKADTSHATAMCKDINACNREEMERNHRISGLVKHMELERRQFHEIKKELREREKSDLLNRVSIVRDSTEKVEDRMKPLKADEEENFNSTGVMKRIFKLAFLNTIQRRHIRQHQKNIEVFEQAFSTIKSTTGISDIEEIVKIFVVLEQRNFSLLTYVNELNSSIETFEKHNRELANQLQDKKQSDENSDAKKEEMLVEIKQQIESTIRGTQENVEEVRVQTEIFERCKPLMRSILKVVEKENCSFGGQAAPTFAGVSENLLEGLTYVEKTVTRWRDYLPESRDAPSSKGSGKNYRYTVGSMGMPMSSMPATLVKTSDLPSAANVALDAGTEKRPALQNREEDSSDEEEDLQSHPWTRAELRDKAVAAVAKRKRFRKQEMPGQQQQQQQQKQSEQLRSEADPAAPSTVGGARGSAEASLDAAEDREEDGSDFGEEAMPSDEELDELFLKQYNMTKEDLLEHAERMQIQLSNLCYLKQEFSACGGDREGYVDVRELRTLLHRLGEEVTNDELDHALLDLDSSRSGEIEFFAFAEWFTTEDENRAGAVAANHPSAPVSSTTATSRRGPGSSGRT
mmetsp:Transcript_28044/g.55103  ORF Transcript_28044/g.55103 Transcript_28044/m.55103 type:complete len:732 (+) Transcript_28044:183-2378(+)